MTRHDQQQRVKRGALATFVVVGPLNSGLAVVSAVTQNTISRLINAIIVAPSMVVLAAGCPYLYVVLRRLINEMDAGKERYRVFVWGDVFQVYINVQRK